MKIDLIFMNQTKHMKMYLGTRISQVTINKQQCTLKVQLSQLVSSRLRPHRQGWLWCCTAPAPITYAITNCAFSPYLLPHLTGNQFSPLFASNAVLLRKLFSFFGIPVRCLMSLVYSPINGSILNWGSLLSNDSSLYQVDIKLSKTINSLSIWYTNTSL